MARISSLDAEEGFRAFDLPVETGEMTSDFTQNESRNILHNCNDLSPGTGLR
jgi:hypothetical protein